MHEGGIIGGKAGFICGVCMSILLGGIRCMCFMVYCGRPDGSKSLLMDKKR